MHLIKPLSLIFLALYLIVVGLQGLGFAVGFVHPGVLGFFALVAGILFLIRGIKNFCCGSCCKVDDRYPNDKYPKV